MQTLAQNGNGTAAYVDNLNEARKVLVEEASSTLFPIAKDVKIQIEWNPARVSEYRLIGYETRALRREDFNNDKVDAGDVGSGHRVTAIYEITPAGAEKKLVDDLRYAKPAKAPEASNAADAELGFLKLRYKLPKEDSSRLIMQPIADSQATEKLASASDDVRFSIAVAAFGQLLKGAPYLGSFDYDDVIELAQNGQRRRSLRLSVGIRQSRSTGEVRAALMRALPPLCGEVDRQRRRVGDVGKIARPPHPARHPPRQGEGFAPLPLPA